MTTNNGGQDPIRFQSGLGSEQTRRYKEGASSIRLSLARVIKVNYKYNTVDVITTLYKNNFTKNPANNGKYSARLPIAFGGRTPDGKVYGANTLVTVGSLVLVGFIEGSKDFPIVLNIYGDTDYQSMLTRTALNSADESDVAIQKEIWQLFSLYPSMTYENVDGRGNREVTFSGKTFMIMSDTDQNNDYINDHLFDYDHLPNSRYANGEQIEPKSAKPPTMLYVHQGVYGKQRLTFFIKSNGDLRIASRNVNETGVSFFELKNDGSIALVQKKGSIDPEAYTIEEARIGINARGNIVLKAHEQLLEITRSGFEFNKNELKNILGEEILDVLDAVKELDKFIAGAFQDGIIEQGEAQSIATYINTLSTEKLALDNRYNEIYANPYLIGNAKTELKKAKDAFETRYVSLIAAINNAIADSKATKEESNIVNLAFSNYNTAFSKLAQTLEIAVDVITRQKAAEAETNAKDYSDTLKQGIDADITALNGSVSALNQYINGAFLDGIIEQNEAQVIASYLHTLNIENRSIGERYNQLFYNQYLPAPVKVILQTKKTTYDTTYTNLINAINVALEDDQTTPEEVAEVNRQFGLYGTALADLTSDFDVAIDIITQEKAAEAESKANSYTDGKITQVNQSVDTKIAGVNQSVDNKIADAYQEINGKVSSDGIIQSVNDSPENRQILKRKVEIPMDSPQVLIEYILFDVGLSPDGVTITLDAKFLAATSNYAVFQNNGTITSKGSSSFVISGIGVADIRIIGYRKGYETVWDI